MASNLWKKVSTPDNVSSARTPSNPSNRMKVSDSTNEDDDKHSMAVVIKWEASLQSNSRRNSSICSKSFGHLKSQVRLDWMTLLESWKQEISMSAEVLGINCHENFVLLTNTNKLYLFLFQKFGANICKNPVISAYIEISCLQAISI